MNDQLFSVEEKIVVVTGGLGQIGAEFVKELHGRGAKVAVFARDVSDRIMVMGNGGVLESGPSEQVMSDPQNERTRQFLKAVLDR